MENIKQKISLEDLKELLDKKYYLSYVDRNDNLDDHLDKLQDAIHGNTDKLNELIDTAFMDGVNANETEAINEVKNEIEKKFDLEQDEAEEIISQYTEELLDEIRERDASTPLKDLLRNTGEQVMFYDLGFEIDGYGVDIKERIKQVKRALKIKIKNEEFDKELWDLCENASYGGRLVVYFYKNVEQFLFLDDSINTIKFSGALNVAIIDNNNGSGADCELSLPLGLTVQFNKENLFIDKTVHYNYTFEVCGLISSWCKSTLVELSENKRAKKKAVTSELNDAVARDKEYEETYRKGGCTLGDNDIKRHRNVIYINNYPCGNKCTQCGNFWID